VLLQALPSSPKRCRRLRCASRCDGRRASRPPRPHQLEVPELTRATARAGRGTGPSNAPFAIQATRPQKPAECLRDDFGLGSGSPRALKYANRLVAGKTRRSTFSSSFRRAHHMASNRPRRLRRETAFVREVVEESVLDHRTDRDLRVGKRAPLRLLVQRPFTPEDVAAIEAKDGRASRRRREGRGRVLPRDRRSRISRAWASTTRPKSLGAFRPVKTCRLYREGAFEDLCRGPQRAEHGKLRHFKLMKVAVPTGAATITTRCCNASTAPPGDEGRAAAAPDDARGSREARPPQARPRARLFHMQEEAPGLVFCIRGWALWQQSTVHARGLPRNGYQEVKGPQSSTRPVGERRALGQLPRNMFHDGVREARIRAQADELPGPTC